jgi:hypothetical protein
MQAAVDSVPDCPSRESLCRLVRSESERLVPQVACTQLLEQAGMVLAPSNAGSSGVSALRGVAG